MDPKKPQTQAPKTAFSGYRLNGSALVGTTNPKWWENDPIATKTKTADIEDMATLSKIGALGGGMDRITVARFMDNADFMTDYAVMRQATDKQFEASGTLAKVDVFFKNGMVVRGITISQHTRNHKLVAGMPFRLYPDQNKVTQRAYDVSFPRETQDSFYATILYTFADCFVLDEALKPWERKPKAEAGADAQAGAAKTESGEAAIGQGALGA